jgi:hypothetical protein
LTVERRRLGSEARLGSQLRVGGRFGDDETQLQLGIDGAVAVIQQLDRELGQWPAVTAQLAGLLQCRLPLLGLDAIFLVGASVANARDLNEPSHQIQSPS